MACILHKYLTSINMCHCFEEKERDGETAVHDLSSVLKEKNTRPEEYFFCFFSVDKKCCLHPLVFTMRSLNIDLLNFFYQ